MNADKISTTSALFDTLKSFSKDLPILWHQENLTTSVKLELVHLLPLTFDLGVVGFESFPFGLIFVHFLAGVSRTDYSQIKFITLILINAPPYRTELLQIKLPQTI